MKTFRTALLAAAIGAGLPAMLQAQDAPQDRRERFREQGEERGERGPRPDGAGRPDRGAQPQAAPQPAPQPQAEERAFRSQDVQRQPIRQDSPDRGNGQNRFGGRFTPGGQQGGNFDGRRPDDRRFDDRRFGDRNAPPIPGRPDRPNGFASGHPGFAPNANWQGPGPGWNGRDWRQDRRYDWRNYRDRNRNIFRGPRYVAPRGWSYGYRRFDIGFRLPPFLFGAQYWIADPWAYRLPPVDGGYRWVRYYDDVLLIDLRSGIIVDSISDFFL